MTLRNNKTKSQASGSSKNDTSKGGMAAGHIPFPFKLHMMLDRVEESGGPLNDIVSWLPDGRSFKVHQKEAFSSGILPEFFSTNKYKSYQRSLNLWGFKTVPKGPDKGVCSHPLFIRGRSELCRQMKRVIIKGTGKTANDRAGTAIINHKGLSDASSKASSADDGSNQNSVNEENYTSSDQDQVLANGIPRRIMFSASEQMGDINDAPSETEQVTEQSLLSGLTGANLVAAVVQVSQLQNIIRQAQEEEAMKQLIAQQQTLQDAATLVKVLALVQILQQGSDGSSSASNL